MSADFKILAQLLFIMMAIVLLLGVLVVALLCTLRRRKYAHSLDPLSLQREYDIPPGDTFTYLAMKNQNDIFSHSVELIDDSTAYLYLHGVAWAAGDCPEVRFIVRTTADRKRMQVSLDPGYGLTPTLSATRYLSCLDSFLCKKVDAERIK